MDNDRLTQQVESRGFHRIEPHHQADSSHTSQHPEQAARIDFFIRGEPMGDEHGKEGVVAFRMEATPEAICCCPQTIREKGTTLFKKLIPKKALRI